MNVASVRVGVGSLRRLRRTGSTVDERQSARRYVYAALLIGVVLLATPDVAAAKDAPPTDGLPSISSQTTITCEVMLDGDEPYTVCHTIQTFADPLEIEASTLITNTTTSGAMWVIERRFTYGEASITILLMASCLIRIFDIILRLAMQRL